MTSTTATAVKTIELVPADDYRRKTYGVLLTSATRHDFVGKRVHNPHHPHTLDVWENRDNSADASSQYRYLDPNNRPTNDRYSYLFNPHAIVIAASPAMRDQTPQGAALSIGDVVELTLHGVVIATVQIAARSLHDPHGELI